MAEPVCVNCGAVRQEHHRDGWCFWLSDADHLPIQYSESERTILVVVDDDGQPLRPPSDAAEPA
jgi:hypothetical protein